MAKEPEDRYASAGDLALAAHEAPSPIPTRTMPTTSCGAVRKPHCPATVERRTADHARHGVTLAQRPLPPFTPPPSSRPFHRSPGGSGPSGRTTPAAPNPPSGHPAWTPASGPILGPSQPAPELPVRQGGDWGAAHRLPAITIRGPDPSWNQARGPPGRVPPSGKRNPWPIIAGLTIVLVLVVGGVGIWLSTRPKPPPPSSNQSPEERLSALLLSSSDIDSVMGSSRMQPGRPITGMDTSSVTISAPGLPRSALRRAAPAYSGTGYTGVSGLASSEPGDDSTLGQHRPSWHFRPPTRPRRSCRLRRDKWKACAGKTVTVTNKRASHTRGRSPKSTAVHRG